ncbi:hypothetical protein CASFOL_010865 [Castilleja foliolosa]|uniref:DUF4378 domain-containing protein n=1 Tax=Castilleja foliolosa TaxID=1961234 RepID=A0ABD3DXV0_9LAMI
MMAKRSSSARNDHQELVSEKSSELKCLWAGLFSILNSCPGHSGPFKLISSRRPVKSNHTDKSRTKFDNQLLQKNEESNLEGTRVNASAKSIRNLMLDDLYIDRHKNESQLVDEKIVQEARTSVKAFIDQMFVEGNFVHKEQTCNEPMPFSEALGVLSTTNNRILFTEKNPHEKSSRRASKIKQKLKHTFGDFTKEPNRFSKARDDCRFHVKTKEKPDDEPGITFLTEKARKKIDYSSSGLSKKRRYLFARLKSLNATGIVETKNIFNSEKPIERNRTDKILLNDESGTTMHSTIDSVSENETLTSVPDLSMSESIEYEEEHQSPVSVLERNNAPDIMTKHIYFDKNSIDSNPQDQPISEKDCNYKQDYIARYVHLLLRASRLNWDRLSKISPQCEELLRASLFKEVDVSSFDHCFDSKLMFDYINEVLVHIHLANFSFLKPRNNYNVPLEELVVDKMMRKTAELYSHCRVEERTVDELVADDMLCSGSWIEAQPETECIVICIVEDILEEYVWDMFLCLYC